MASSSYTPPGPDRAVQTLLSTARIWAQDLTATRSWLSEVYLDDADPERLRIVVQFAWSPNGGHCPHCGPLLRTYPAWDWVDDGQSFGWLGPDCRGCGKEGQGWLVSAPLIWDVSVPTEGTDLFDQIDRCAADFAYHLETVALESSSLKIDPVDL